MNSHTNMWPWVREPKYVQDKNLPLYIQLQKEIKALIDSNYWEPDEQIPTELVISKCFNISINTVKKGLHGLVTEGYLYRRQGYGTFVASIIKRPNSSHPMVDAYGNLIEPIVTQLLHLEKGKANAEIAEHLKVKRNTEIYLLKRVQIGRAHV